MQERKKRKKITKKDEKAKKIITLIILITICLFFIGYRCSRPKLHIIDYEKLEAMVEKRYLTVNPYSRPQRKLNNVNGIVVHYVANPGSSADANWHYFEGLSKSHETKASAHFIIGLEGEIIQCIPLDEWAYASNQRNKDTISIECCHPGSDGKFTQETYNSLVSLCRWLMDIYDLDADDVIRHYDVTGKLCPLYFVEHEDAWDKFKNDIKG